MIADSQILLTVNLGCLAVLIAIVLYVRWG